MQKSVTNKYSTLKNSAHIIRTTWAQDKRTVLIIPAVVVISTAITLLWVLFPAAVAGQVVYGDSVERLLLILISFLLAFITLGALQAYVFNFVPMRRNMMATRTAFSIRKKIMTTSYPNLERQEFSDLRQKAMSATYSTPGFLWDLESFLANVLGLLVFLIMLSVASPILILVALGAALISVFARNKANAWRFKNDDKEANFQKRLHHINYLGQEFSMGKDIRLFKMAPWVQSVFAKNIDRAYRFSFQVEMRQFGADIVGGFANGILAASIYAFLIYQMLNNGMALDTFIMLSSATYAFSGQINGVLLGMANMANQSRQYTRVRQLVDFEEIFDGTEPIAPDLSKAYTLTMENVSLRYSGAAHNTLENVNLTIKPGENLAVVGLNGAGKTTLVKLLCGFYDPTEGAVKLNGIDIRRYNREDYYRLFTAVFQDFSIMPNTIAENIAQEITGNIHMEKIATCLDIAELTHKVSTLPHGVHSLMQKGVNLDAIDLSGGQIQRLMLARALYKNAPILVLDEPTAALDPIAERNMYQRYHDFAKDRTSIYISHRLASTRFCDRIILVDNKGIAEEGTHDTLMALGGKYAELFDIQSKYYKEGVAQDEA